MSNAQAEAERRYPNRIYIDGVETTESVRFAFAIGYDAGAQCIEDTRVKALEAALTEACDYLESSDLIVEARVTMQTIQWRALANQGPAESPHEHGLTQRWCDLCGDLPCEHPAVSDGACEVCGATV